MKKVFLILFLPSEAEFLIRNKESIVETERKLLSELVDEDKKLIHAALQQA